MVMFFEQNVRSVGMRGVQAVQAVGQLAVPQHIEPFTTRDGLLTLRYRGVWLHNPNHALLEAQAAVNALAQPGANRVHVVLGLGLGYVLQQLFDSSEGVIVLYEPFTDLLRFVLEHVNLSHLLAQPRVYLVTDPTDLMDTVRQLMTGGVVDAVDVMMLPAYATLLGEAQYNRLIKGLYELEGERLMTEHSAQTHGLQWLRHVVANSDQLQGAFPLEALKVQFAHIPAIVITADDAEPDNPYGLVAQLPLLHTVQPKAIIIALAHTVPMLLAQGILPDFVVVWDADPHPELMHHTVGLQLVLPVWANPDLFLAEGFTRWVMNTQQHPPFHHWLDMLYGEPLDALPACQSAVAVACQLAHWMGCKSLTLAGFSGSAPSEYTGQWVTLPTLDTDQNPVRVTAPHYFMQQALTAMVPRLTNRGMALYYTGPQTMPIEGFEHVPLADAQPWEDMPPVYKALYPLRSCFPGGMAVKLLPQALQAAEQLLQTCQVLQAPADTPLFWQSRCNAEALVAAQPLIRFWVGQWLHQAVALCQTPEAWQQALQQIEYRLRQGVLPLLQQGVANLAAVSPTHIDSVYGPTRGNRSQAELVDTVPLWQTGVTPLPPSIIMDPPSGLALVTPHPPSPDSLWMGWPVCLTPEQHWLLHTLVCDYRPDTVIWVNPAPGTALFTDQVLQQVDFGKLLCAMLPTPLSSVLTPQAHNTNVLALPSQRPALKVGRYTNQMLAVYHALHHGTVLWVQHGPRQAPTPTAVCVVQEDDWVCWVVKPD
jgi:hypothetical protein